MKIILSRKGFDSGAGGFPNPILPSGRLCMLPIPDKHSVVQYRHIHLDDDSLPRKMSTNLGGLVSQLTERRISPLRRAHLDPDLDFGSLPRKAGWHPSFGQRGAALGHLQKQGVGPGDLFLFFGWFKEIEVVSGRLRYVGEAPDLHVLFGWLQVDDVLDLTTAQTMPSWLHPHPHLQERFQAANGTSSNVLYTSRPSLELSGQTLPHAGAGVFPHFAPHLQLSSGNVLREGNSTDCGHKLPSRELRSRWLLPAWFRPVDGRPALTYHGDPSRWQMHPEGALLQTVGRGQEFVLDCAAYPESMPWLHTFFDV